jgi:cytochrome c biogenesis protein CcdA/thiol-disulfide isomerase/thioredoxin
MLLALLGIGLVAGGVAGISPCILPVLPVLLASTARTETERGRRPVLVVGGLVTSFAIVTLLGAAALSSLGLPQATLMYLGVGALSLVGLGMLVPAVGHVIETPFRRLTQGAKPRAKSGRGFLLGLSLGVVFVPCAGPVLAAVTTLGAAGKLGTGTVVLTVGYSLGVAVPLLLLASAGNSLTSRVRTVRVNSPRIRQVAGAVMLASALAIGFNVLAPLQRALPGYSSALQSSLETSTTLRDAVSKARGATAAQQSLRACLDRVEAAGGLADHGCQAPDFTGIKAWFNTLADRALTVAGLRGKVVLVDFWTYSCINCQRTLPHLRAFDAAYRNAGLTIVGVHTPEFAFEHSLPNVRSAAKSLGVRWPVALDNDYATWNAYSNNYWPAEYLIDQTGVVRHVHYGEGSYDETSQLIATLLHTSQAAGSAGTDTAAGPTTPESYVGYARANSLANGPVAPDTDHRYVPDSAVPLDAFELGGSWNVGEESARAARSDASLSLRFRASKVFLVLSGHGSVTPTLDGKTQSRISVSGTPRLYTLVSGSYRPDSLLSLRFSAGLSAYAFTFG